MIRETIYFVVMAATLAIWLACHKKVDRSFLMPGIFLCINFPLELYALALLLQLKNNLFLYHFQLPLEFWCISFYFFRVIQKDAMKRAIIITSVAVVLTCIFFSLFIQKIPRDNSYSTLLCNVVLTLCALINLLDLLYSKEAVTLKTCHRFWMSIACLAYYPGNMLINVMIAYVWKADNAIADKLWTIDYVFNTLFYFFIGVALLINGKVGSTSNRGATA